MLMEETEFKKVRKDTATILDTNNIEIQIVVKMLCTLSNDILANALNVPLSL